MAATKTPKRARLDFATMLNESIATIGEQDMESNKVDTIINQPIETDSSNTKKEETTHDHIKEDITIESEGKNEEKAKQPKKNEKPVKEYTETKPKKASNNQSNVFLSLTKSTPGVQRSVYFEASVFEYIQKISNQYDVKFSNVVNLLLKQAIAEQEK